MNVNNSFNCVTVLAQESIENQSLNPWGQWRRGVLITCLAMVAVIFAILFSVRCWQASAPYIRDVLALQGDEGRGEAIFQMNCAVCHGIEATGEVGPSLRGVAAHRTRVSLIQQVISGQTPPMPQFQPTPQDMADLLEYLEQL